MKHLQTQQPSAAAGMLRAFLSSGLMPSALCLHAMLIQCLPGAATTGMGMRGVTNSAGTIGNTGRAAGVVSADVMPSSTNQGGGIRPTVSHPAHQWSCTVQPEGSSRGLALHAEMSPCPLARHNPCKAPIPHL